ncbi:MAG: phospholipase D-like domain-containing protein [Elusimicrobiaceae bacterium]
MKKRISSLFSRNFLSICLALALCCPAGFAASAPAEKALPAIFALALQTNVEVTTPVVSEGRAGVSPRNFPDYAFSDEVLTGNFIVKAVDMSVKSVEVSVFSLTLQEVSSALIRARDRGVAVRVIIDQNHVFTKVRDEAVQMLIDANINLKTLRGTWDYGVNHNKIGIYDGKFVSAGSFNWSDNAVYNNYENIAFVKTPGAVIGFRSYFEYMWSVARPYSAGPVGPIQYGSYPKPPAGPLVINFNGQGFPEYSFSPLGGSRETLMKAVASARKTIDLASFTLSDKELAKALQAAHSRGIKVRIMTDKATAKKRGFVSWFMKNGMEVKLAGGRSGGSMHHKFAIFDKALLETGSHNWTGNADVNDFENVYYTAAPGYLKAYQNKFEQIYAKAFVPDINTLPAPEDMNSDGPAEGRIHRAESDFEVD